MKNNKGFTLTEVLLAALIVGVIGIALAALTTAAMREGKVGQSKAMLRSQLSLALRQLRQDVEQASGVSVSGTTLTLYREYPIGPDLPSTNIVYRYNQTAKTITRQEGTGAAQDWLINVVKPDTQNGAPLAVGGFTYPRFELLPSATVSSSSEPRVYSALRVTIVVEVEGGNRTISEVVDEIFVLPHGFAVKETAAGGQNAVK